MSDTASANHGSLFNLLDVYVKSPFSGLAPWIVMSLISGPGTFEIAVVAAFALSLATFLVSRRGGGTFKLMEIFDLLFFAGFAIYGLVASASSLAWLEMWAGELTNIALLAFVLITILIRHPFTLQYAKEQTDPQYWDQPAFLRINYVITWVWALAFAVQAASGLFGDAVLEDNNNFWTGWVIQIGAIVFAVAFTEWYPDYAVAKVGGEKLPSKAALVKWIPGFILVVGIAGLLFDATTSLVGWALIVLGGVGIIIVKGVDGSANADRASAGSGS